MKLLSLKPPVIVGMIKSVSMDGILAEIERIRNDGADAYGFQLEGCSYECKTKDSITRILSNMSDKPVYFTNYMRRNSRVGITWEEIEKELLIAAEAGADLIDIPGDMYLSSDMELTCDKSAVDKQIKLIAKLHDMGCDVLMSSHVLKYVDNSTVLNIAKEHERRGADVTKIVIDTNTEEQLGDAFVASVRLREEIGIGTLLLCNGKESKTHRFIGPIFGSTLLLATENSLTGQDQPTIAAAKEIIRYRDISGGGFFR